MKLHQIGCSFEIHHFEQSQAADNSTIGTLGFLAMHSLFVFETGEALIQTTRHWVSLVICFFVLVEPEASCYPCGCHGVWPTGLPM